MINATALLAAVGDGSAFAKGRDLAAWLGLTPRQHSTGGKTKLLGISKRGNKYLRTQLIHGARAALTHFAKTPKRIGAWVRGSKPATPFLSTKPLRKTDHKGSVFKEVQDE